jgi:hypothetical protein
LVARSGEETPFVVTTADEFGEPSPAAGPDDVPPVDPDLAKILAAWSGVPEHLKAVAVANVLALVATAQQLAR